MFRAALVLALLLALPAPAAERASRARVSADGVFSVRLVEEAPGQCRLEVSKESGPVWSLAQCVGLVDDLYFVSNDGERVWVMRPLAQKAPEPKVRTTRKKKSQVPGWARVPVATLYGREGQRLDEKYLTDFVAPRNMGEVRELSGHFKWLEGTLGIPGKGPRLMDAGHIEFESVGGKHHRLTF
ncbi:hypothetical protein P2318_31950 [Myxococcaceae bacterium GXIMD 01537]